MNSRFLTATFGCYLVLGIVAFPGCSRAKDRPESQMPIPTPSPVNSQPVDDILLLNSVFVRDDSLTYGNFTIRKQSRKANLDGLKVDVLYAALKKNEKPLRKLDGNVYFGAGNSIDFGLFSFLNAESKQLLVSQQIPRRGAHWVVDVSSDGRVIFDSKKYEVGREEFQVCDIDRDGTYEILLPVVSFYMFEDYAVAETPLPIIIFKYDKGKQEYIPANPEFRDFALRDVDEAITRIPGVDSASYLPKMLDVILTYIYAGKEDIAWQFFETHYQRFDKEKMKWKLINEIKNGPAYKYIYRNRSQN